MNHFSNRSLRARTLRLFGTATLIAIAATSCSSSTPIATDSGPVATQEAPQTAATEAAPAPADPATLPATPEVSQEAPSEPDTTAATASTAEWNGPVADSLLDARMAELTAPFGMPFSPGAVAALFATPP